MKVLKKQKLLELFEEVLERFESAEAYCIQDFQVGEDEYSHKDLKNDIKEYKRMFLALLEG